MNDKDERTHQARQAAEGSKTSAAQATGGSGASGTSGARRKRRRRGGRGRNNRGRAQAANNATGATGAQGGQGARGTQGSEGSANPAAPSRPSQPHKPAAQTGHPGEDQSGKDSASQPRRRRRRQGGKGASKGTGKNSQRSGNRRGQRGGHSQRRSSARGGRNGHLRRGPHPRRGAAAVSNFDTRRETSAGGLVVSGLAEAVAADGSVDLSRLYVALIGRLDRRRRLLWSMPKGHVEPGEDQRATAQREVWEETGISGEVFAELGVIDYWFVSEGVRIHKTVHHHLLRYVDGYLNDEDPEVTEVSWIPVHQLIEHLAYADERKLARVAHDILPDLARAEKRAGRRTPR
ncbi:MULTISPECIES: NUDIX hydrolase [unclassified Corynebacterium]|uniref:NUDIX hydrolase n=1 Tax=unclassified Corynebacterium TaxID=2624378 RepID=UPI0029CAA59A|nr:MULTISPECIES: NUDIX domain-containing protein [unclassified Corynebacterium]WPF66147.1 NUDIX domain-containing protein [Corynebacterium sp. 22KM0430]WPF68640.1 NUDIX domain-containing protein [Corynebacterium sp. 21KM1197]